MRYANTNTFNKSDKQTVKNRSYVTTTMTGTLVPLSVPDNDMDENCRKMVEEAEALAAEALRVAAQAKAKLEAGSYYKAFDSAAVVYDQPASLATLTKSTAPSVESPTSVMGTKDFDIMEYPNTPKASNRRGSGGGSPLIPRRVRFDPLLPPSPTTNLLTEKDELHQQLQQDPSIINDHDDHKDFLEVFLDTMGVDRACGFDDATLKEKQKQLAADDHVGLKRILDDSQLVASLDPFEQDRSTIADLLDADFSGMDLLVDVEENDSDSPVAPSVYLQLETSDASVVRRVVPPNEQPPPQDEILPVEVTMGDLLGLGETTSVPEELASVGYDECTMPHENIQVETVVDPVDLEEGVVFEVVGETHDRQPTARHNMSLAEKKHVKAEEVAVDEKIGLLTFEKVTVDMILNESEDSGMKIFEKEHNLSTILEKSMETEATCETVLAMADDGSTESVNEVLVDDSAPLEVELQVKEEKHSNNSDIREKVTEPVLVPGEEELTLDSQPLLHTFSHSKPFSQSTFSTDLVPTRSNLPSVNVVNEAMNAAEAIFTKKYPGVPCEEIVVCRESGSSIKTVTTDEETVLLVEDKEEAQMINQIMDSQSFCCSCLGLPPC